MSKKTVVEACLNGHDPDYIEIRPNGSRVCAACRSDYFREMRNHRTNPSKDPKGADRNDERR